MTRNIHNEHPANYQRTWTIHLFLLALVLPYGCQSLQLVLLRDSSRLRQLLTTEFLAGLDDESDATMVNDNSQRLWILSGPSYNYNDVDVGRIRAVERSMELLVDLCATPDELIHRVGALGLVCNDGWTVVTETVLPFVKNDRPDAKSLLMSLAQTISGKPLLFPRHEFPSNFRFVVVETDQGFLFGRSMKLGPSLVDKSLLRTWKSRPFSFSAALCLELAVLALSVMQSVAAKSEAAKAEVEEVTFVDGCCGTGTSLLAAALVLKSSDSSAPPLRLIGSDVNGAFVTGAKRNLDLVLPSLNATTTLQIFHCDATEIQTPATTFSDTKKVWPIADFVFMNLPWNVNKPESFFGDNSKIVSQLALALKVGGIACIISRSEIEQKTLSSSSLSNVRGPVHLDGDSSSKGKDAGKCVVHFCIKN